MKENRIKLPDVPERCLNHFIRGYFDGDGCISYGFYKRKNRNNKKRLLFTARFISSSKKFLEDISKRLTIYAETSHGCMAKYTGYYNLTYSKNDSIKLFKYMYKNIENRLFLERKFEKFQGIFKILGVTY